MDEKLIQDVLGHILLDLGLSFEGITIIQEADVTRIEISSNDVSRMIGWHGETLNSIQHILKSIVRNKEKLSRTPFLVLDVDGYRRMQEEKVCKVAEQKADFVRRTGSRVALAPMSPYFRRIVHLYVANTSNLQDLTTESIGEGDYRQIVLRLKDQKGAQGEELQPVFSKEDGLENLDI